MKFLQYNATVASRVDLTDALAVFRVVPDEPAKPFIPGQYAVLGLNHDERGGVQRAYSIASAPHEIGNGLEYYIRYVKNPASDNPLTHLLWHVRDGDRILQRPKIVGHFTVPKCMGEADKRLKILVAAGTGLAPFRSMVVDHYHRHGNCGDFAIVHGASYPTDLGYREELDGIMNTGGAKRYVCSISRPKEAVDWEGMIGRAESHFNPGKLEELEKHLGLGKGGINPSDCTVMICGLQGTIAETIKGLLYRGFVPADIKLRRGLGVKAETPASVFFEQYDSDPVIDTTNEEVMVELSDRLRTAGVPVERIVGADT